MAGTSVSPSMPDALQVLSGPYLTGVWGYIENEFSKLILDLDYYLNLYVGVTGSQSWLCLRMIPETVKLNKTMQTESKRNKEPIPQNLN